MKNKTDRKAMQEKLNHAILALVRSVTAADSKKINKIIKKASKMIAKAVAKEINAGKIQNPFNERAAVPKRAVRKQTQPKTIKRIPLSRVVRKINKITSVKSKPQKQEPIFVSHDGVDKTGK